MPEKPDPVRKLSEKNTKQEMLEAYQALLKQFQEKRAAELAPARQLEEKRVQEAVRVAETLSPAGIERDLGSLKAEIGRLLADLAEKLDSETAKFKAVQKAVEAKQLELQELYGIEKAAATLAALIEAQNLKRRESEIQLTAEREELTEEIEATRAEWERDKRLHDAEIKERDAAEKKAREREKEEFAYLFKRDQQSVKDKLADEKITLEKELKQKREAAEKELAERERAIAGQEQELAIARARVAAFPKELEAAVDKAVKEITDKLKLEAKNREDLLRKESEGERNVSATRIESLEKALKECADQNTRMTRQLEAAYQKVQDIAEKTVEGASQSKSLADLQKLLAEQARKTAPDKG